MIKCNSAKLVKYYLKAEDLITTWVQRLQGHQQAESYGTQKHQFVR